MSFGVPVKEKIARVIADYFTTNDIVNIFADVNIHADASLFAKWRITLDAFGKMSKPEEAIPDILIAFCHPLNFWEPQSRTEFIAKLNAILRYEEYEIKATDRSEMLYFNKKPVGSAMSTAHFKTSIDYVIEAINFFKNEYNKIRMSGLAYEYPIGENADSHFFDGGHEEYGERLKAIKQLKDVGFITEYRIEARVDSEEDFDYVWDYAICKIDDSKITQKEAPPATDAGVQNLAQKIIHEHTHRFENSIQEKEIDLSHKVEITKMPEVQVRNVEDDTMPKGKKRIRLPKFGPTDWSKVTIRFLDERNVFITADKKQVQADYETLGFADEKRGKPNLAWVFFRGLAQNNGETEPLPTPIPDTIKQQKRQLSDRLKTIFKNDTDPFHDPTETRIYKIKIKLEPPQSEGESRDEYGIQEHLKETAVGGHEEKRKEYGE